MTSLISELGSDEEMQSQFEAMMSELLLAGQAPTNQEAAAHVLQASENVPAEQTEDEDNTKKSGSGAGAGASGADFQSTIRKTMERMQASSDTATAASTTSGEGAGGSEEEMLAQMMRELGAGSGGGAGAGGEEDFNSMLMGMMTQLTNKEILYEPMKELDEKFPAWMERNDSKEGGGSAGDGSAEGVKGEDMQRYKEQWRLVGEIVGRFERSGYSDGDEADREFIVERMQKVGSFHFSRLQPNDCFSVTDDCFSSFADASPRFAAPGSRGRYECGAGGAGGFGCRLSDAMTKIRPRSHDAVMVMTCTCTQHLKPCDTPWIVIRCSS